MKKEFEKLLIIGEDYFPNTNLKESERQEIFDEILEKEREFGALINYQRDQEKR